MRYEEKKVLVAEDDEDVLLVLKEGLTEMGYSVLGACDGKEAFKKIIENRPALILLDIMMPELNGVELNKKLKKNNKLKDIPVIIITGRANMHGLFSDHGENKVSGFLEKPFSLEVLKCEIERILNHI